MRWFTPQRHTVRHGAPQTVFQALRQLMRTARRRKALAAGAPVADNLSDVEQRQDMVA
ncbi:MAG: hypothetical protein ACRD0M_07770 [Acidimicrobiales bacterium]